MEEQDNKEIDKQSKWICKDCGGSFVEPITCTCNQGIYRSKLLGGEEKINEEVPHV